MAHPNLHAKSSAKKFGGKPEDYIHLHEWLDETKSWFGDSLHRMFRHHSEGIFEMEKRFGSEFKNSVPLCATPTRRVLYGYQTKTYL